MPAPPAVLRLEEAIELGHAWVHGIAQARGIRALLIKGPALHRQGLRMPRTSADIDLLVEPAGFIDLCAALESAGWVERPSTFLSERTTLHSKTYVRDGWPCDLDAHRFFPGFLADPAEVFEALWRRREVMSFAGIGCHVPDRVANVLVLALHSLRGGDRQSRHAAELDQLAAVELTSREREEIAALAVATGSAGTLADVLPRLGVRVEADAGGAALQEWRERVESGSGPAYLWMLTWRKARGRERVAVLWRAFWPSRADFSVAHPEIPERAWRQLRGRAERWGRGIRSLPRTVRALWRHRVR